MNGEPQQFDCVLDNVSNSNNNEHLLKPLRHVITAKIHLFQYKMNGFCFFPFLFVKEIVAKKGQNRFGKRSKNI